MGSLLSCGGCTKHESKPGKLLGAFPGGSPENACGKFPRKRPGKESVARHPGLAGFCTTTTMIIASPILVGAPEPGPVTDQGRCSGSREEQVSQQMPHFGGGQGNERGRGPRSGVL